MDQAIKKRLNKQAILFVAVHTIFIFNLAFDFFEIQLI